MAGVQKREIPTCIESEEALLGAILEDATNVFVNVSEYIKADDFYNGANRLIYSVCADLFENQEPVDIVTVAGKLAKLGKIEEIGGYAYLSQLAGGDHVCANAEAYAKNIAEKSTERKLIEYAQIITKEAYDDEKTAEQLISIADEKFRQIVQGTGGKSWSDIGSVLPEIYDAIEASVGKNGITGIPTGFVELDKQLHGLQEANLVLIGARPGMGKTAFMLDIAKYAAIKKNIPVVVFNLEMSKREMATRILSSYSGVLSEKFSACNLTAAEWGDVAKACGEISHAPLYFDDALDSSIQSIRAKCRKLVQENGVKLIIIDYLQLVTSSLKKNSANRQEEVSEISRSLKMMARELKVPVIVGCQLNRDLDDRNDKRPLVTDLRESGTLEQDADIVLMLYRDVCYNKETKYPNSAEVIIRKFRNGRLGTIELIYDAEHVSFRNMAKGGM